MHMYVQTQTLLCELSGCPHWRLSTPTSNNVIQTKTITKQNTAVTQVELRYISFLLNYQSRIKTLLKFPSVRHKKLII